MIYSPKAIANYYLSKAKADSQQLTQMKLHKLLYYAHGWNLGIHGRPLIDETVEAWKYGPVVRSLYYEFRDLGAGPINRKATDFDPYTTDLTTPEVEHGDSETQGLLSRVWQIYGKLTAGQLSQMTHEHGSPWTKTWDAAQGIKGVDIPNELLREYFKLKAEQNRARAART